MGLGFHMETLLQHLEITTPDKLVVTRVEKKPKGKGSLVKNNMSRVDYMLHLGHGEPADLSEVNQLKGYDLMVVMDKNKTARIAVGQLFSPAPLHWGHSQPRLELGKVKVMFACTTGSVIKKLKQADTANGKGLATLACADGKTRFKSLMSQKDLTALAKDINMKFNRRITAGIEEISLCGSPINC